MKRPALTVLVGLFAVVALQGCASDGGWGGGGGHGRHGHGRHGNDAGGPAQEAQAGPKEGLQLKRFDLDGDGSVTKDELDRALHAEFAKYDVDHDGVLNASEAGAANAAIAGLADGSSPVFDWNADGHIDFKEYSTQWLSLFDRLDTNQDGIVTPDEMTKPQHGPRGGQGGAGTSGGGRHRGGQQGGGPSGQP